MESPGGGITVRRLRWRVTRNAPRDAPNPSSATHSCARRSVGGRNRDRVGRDRASRSSDLPWSGRSHDLDLADRQVGRKSRLREVTGPGPCQARARSCGAPRGIQGSQRTVHQASTRSHRTAQLRRHAQEPNLPKLRVRSGVRPPSTHGAHLKLGSRPWHESAIRLWGLWECSFLSPYRAERRVWPSRPCCSPGDRLVAVGVPRAIPLLRTRPR